MQNELPDEQQRQLEEVDRLLDELVVLLEDDATPASERAAQATARADRTEAIINGILAAGVSRDNPVLADLFEKARKIGPRLKELTREASAPPPVEGPTGGRALGMRAARIERDCYEQFVALLAEDPASDRVLEKLKLVRDESMRDMAATGAQRDFFLSTVERGRFRKSLEKNLAGPATESRRRIEQELMPRYGNTPVQEVIRDILGLNRLLERKRVSDQDQTHVERLGLWAGGSDRSRGLLQDVDRMLDELMAILEDDSRPETDRVAAVRNARPGLDAKMLEALSDGFTRIHPVVGAVEEKSRRVMVRMMALDR